jgi:hypothetical protein
MKNKCRGAKKISHEKKRTGEQNFKIAKQPSSLNRYHRGRKMVSKKEQPVV